MKANTNQEKKGNKRTIRITKCATNPVTSRMCQSVSSIPKRRHHHHQRHRSSLTSTSSASMSSPIVPKVATTYATIIQTSTSHQYPHRRPQHSEATSTSSPSSMSNATPSALISSSMVPTVATTSATIIQASTKRPQHPLQHSNSPHLQPNNHLTHSAQSAPSSFN